MYPYVGAEVRPTGNTFVPICLHNMFKLCLDEEKKRCVLELNSLA